MEPIKCSETSAFSTRTPGRYPKENALHIKHSESLKSRIRVKIKSLHINHVSSPPHHYTSQHFTYLHLIPIWIPLLVTTFLTLFLSLFSLQGKDASKLAGNWFQLLMVQFTKEYLPTSVLCFLVLIFQLWSPLHHTQQRATVGRTPLDEWSARRRDLYLTTHNTHYRQTSMLPVGFEPTISAGERWHTYVLDRAAIRTGPITYLDTSGWLPSNL